MATSILWNSGTMQQTPAVQQLLHQVRGRSLSQRRKRTKKLASAPRAKRSARSSGSGTKKAKSRQAKFVKGSPAARRHMAKLRAMRKR